MRAFCFCSVSRCAVARSEGCLPETFSSPGGQPSRHQRGDSHQWNLRVQPHGPREEAHAAILRSPSQSVRNPTTWFQLGITGDAGPEIRNSLGAFLYAARSRPGVDRAVSLRGRARITGWSRPNGRLLSKRRSMRVDTG